MTEDYQRANQMYLVNNQDEFVFTLLNKDKENYKQIVKPIVEKSEIKYDDFTFLTNYRKLNNYCVKKKINKILLKNVNSLYFLIAFTFYNLNINLKGALKEIKNGKIFIIKYYRFFENNTL
jgi:predicted regulator of Ras-like GTPase activity (Roadblock/LC7/MglB family)